MSGTYATRRGDRPKMHTYYVGRYRYNDGTSGIAVVREDDRPPYNGRDALPPTMLEVCPIIAANKREAWTVFVFGCLVQRYPVHQR